MKTNTFLKNPIISLFISLVLVFSLMAISITVEPVNAAATTVTITNPITASPAYSHTDGDVTVYFDAAVDAAGLADINIQVLQSGTSTVVASKDVQNSFTDNNTINLNWDVTLTDVSEGQYDLKVRIRHPAGTGTWVSSTTESNAVIVDNTPPTVTLTTPNGGNYVKSDADYTISWNATDAIPATDNVTVSAKYSLDGGLTYPTNAFTAVSKAKGVNSATWPHANIPDGDYSTARIQLTVIDAAGNQTVVTSASNFYILNTAPTINISVPNASTSWNGNSTQTITFTTFSQFSLNVDYKLEFSSDGATWTNVTPGTDGWVTNQPSGVTSHAWTVNNTYRGASARIRATVRDKVLRTANTTSALFTIVDTTKPTITLTAPQAGDKVYNGGSPTIDWNATDNVAGVNLVYNWYLSIDGGTSWALLGTETSAQGTKSKTWTPSTTEVRSNCKIRVIATDLATPTANTENATSGAFYMYPSGVNPTVTLTSPLGGESWQGGTSRAITWTASDPNDASGTLTYLLEYSHDGATWPDIATLTDRDQGSNAFCWAVPTTADTDYQVRVTATSPGGGAATDTSDAFTVTGADAAVIAATLPLKAGWNLVSLELMPVVCPSTSTSFSCSYPIESVLADCLARIDSVWYYPQGLGTTWLHWQPGAPSSLTTMTDGKAYWIYISAGGDINATYLGRKGPAGGGFPTTPYQYYTGYNQVGFKSTAVDKQVQTYLGGTPGTTYVVPIYGWNAATQLWTTPAATDNMTPDSGYWVYFNVNHIVNAPAD